MNEIRIGIIGSGFIAKTHAISIKRFARRAVLTGIAGGKRCSALAAELDIRAYADVRQMIDSHDIDAVIITSPHEYHHQHAMLCAGHGKHMLLEKPMATSVQQCQEIIDAVEQNHLRLMIAFTQRYRQSNRLAKDILRSGELGRILMIQDWQLLPGGLSNLPEWQRKRENLGVLFGYGVHNIDRLRWFLESDVEDVYAQSLDHETGIESTTMAVLRFKNRTMVSLWTGVDIPGPGFSSRSFRAHIVGEHGLLDLDGYGAVKKSVHGNAWETLFVQPPIEMKGERMFSEVRMGSFNAQNQEFIDSMLENREPSITGRDGLKSVEVALAIYRAAVENEVVHL